MQTLSDDMIRAYFEDNPSAMYQLLDDCILLHRELIEDILDCDREGFDEYLEARYGDVRQWEY